MASGRARHRSNFDRIAKFILNRVRRHRNAITVARLQRTLNSSFDFRKRHNVNTLMYVMDYLLYTRRLIVVDPDESPGVRPQRTPPADGCDRRDRTAVFNVITRELLSSFTDAFQSNPSNVMAQNICTNFDPFQIAMSRQRMQDGIALNHYFSHKIVDSGYPISNQKNSGRCWIFACLNVIRVPFMRKYRFTHFEFSQAYLFFWDKIERSNYFLNAIVSTAKNGHALDSRTVMCLLKKPVEDGGYWTMAVNIIKKYGLMPKYYFPECYSSEDSSELNEILNSKLREFAIVLHDMVTNKSTDGQIANEIEKDMCMVYRIVGICLDIPQQTFKWYVRDGRTCSYQVITPLQFYETVVRPVFNFDDKVCLISCPTPNNEFGQLYMLDLTGNVVEGSRIVYNNQPIEVLLEACKQSIIALDEPVWYSCEVDQRFSNEFGFEDLKILDVESIFGTDISIPMTKCERIQYRDSCPTHAMVLTGLHVENFQNGEVTRWRIENSWGKQTNMNGHIMMTTEWFKEYVFGVVVDKKLLPKHVLDVFNQEPTILPIWDQVHISSLVN